MPELSAPLPHLGVRGQEAIHRPLGTEIRALVEQGGVDLARRQVHETRRVQLLEHGRAFCVAEGPRRPPPRRRGSRGPEPTVVRRAGQPEGRARGGDAQPRSDLGDRRHHEDGDYRDGAGRCSTLHSRVEGHHPALLTEWGRVTVTWWTHKIRALHRERFPHGGKDRRAGRRERPSRIDRHRPPCRLLQRHPGRGEITKVAWAPVL
jgi:hypothetical protein